MNTTRKTLYIFWQHAWRYPKYVLGLLISVPLTMLVHQFLPPIIAANVLDRLSAGDFTPNDLWGSFGNDTCCYTQHLLYLEVPYFGA